VTHGVDDEILHAELRALTLRIGRDVGRDGALCNRGSRARTVLLVVSRDAGSVGQATRRSAMPQASRRMLASTSRCRRPGRRQRHTKWGCAAACVERRRAEYQPGPRAVKRDAPEQFGIAEATRFSAPRLSTGVED